MTQEDCCSSRGRVSRQRQRIFVRDGGAFARIRCGSSSQGSALGCASADATHNWLLVGARRKQKVTNLSKQVERLTIDIARERTHPRTRRIGRQLGGRKIASQCNTSSGQARKKRYRKVSDKQSRRTISQNGGFARHKQQDVSQSTIRCASAHNFHSTRGAGAGFQGRQLTQPLIDHQSATSLSSASSGSMRNLGQLSWRTQSSRASASSLSLIQFSRRSEAGPEHRRSSDHSLDALKIDWIACDGAGGAERGPASCGSADEQRPRRSPRKRSAATHFREDPFSRRPTWRTDLTNSDLSAYASSSDEYEEDDVFHTPRSTSKLGPARRSHSPTLLDESDLRLFDDLSGFGARVAKFSSADEEPSRSYNPQASSCLAAGRSHGGVRKSPRFKLARRQEAVSSHSLDIHAGVCAKDLKSDLVASEGAQKSSVQIGGRESNSKRANKPLDSRMPLMTQIRRPRFGYWPLVSLSSAFSTSTSTANRAASSYSTEACQDMDPRTSRAEFMNELHKSRALRNYSKQVQKSPRQLKYFIQENLVASLIGLYILVSLATIFVLMVPYVSSLFERPVRVSVETQTSDSSEIAVQRQQESMIRKMTSLGDVQEPPSSQQQQQQQAIQQLASANQTAAPAAKNSSLAADEAGSTTQRRQLDMMKKRLILARVVQMRAETKSRESESFQELWRVVHKKPCTPLKIPFCSRSLASMLPDSATINADFMASLPADYSMAYDRTLLPNQFTMGRQSQVERVLERYDPLVDVRCYSLMPLFLCSIFAPKCVQINATLWSQNQRHDGDNPTPGRSPLAISKTHTRKAAVAPPSEVSGQKDPPDVKESVDYLDHLFPALKTRSGSSMKAANKSNGERVQLARLVPPCRSVCKEALRKCSFFLEVLSLTLFTAEDCENLPESSDEKVCVGQKENLLLERAQANMRCRSDEFRCSNGDCIPQKWHCDGFTDCSDKSDEQHCSKCDAASQFYCGHDVCINKSQVCDGRIDCRDGRDERLCLRLSNNSTSMIARKPHLRRLEAWNATLGQWAPVCGNHWQPVPMSHEACQVLGYSRANETLILFDSPASASETVGRRVARSPPMLDHPVSYEQGQQAKDLEPGGAPTREPDARVRTDNRVEMRSVKSEGESQAKPVASSSLKSLAGLLQTGTRCEPASNARAAEELLISSVYLSCQGFQCGRSVTSYLSRVQQQQLLSPIPAPPMVSSVAIATGSSSSERPPLRIKSPTPPSVRSLMSSVHLRSTEVDSRSTSASDISEEWDDTQEAADSEFAEAIGETEMSSELEESGADVGAAPVSARLVVGGIESMPGEFPYLAALHGGPDEVFFCGGVLISTNWLLTAAHCVGNRTQPDGWMVKVGVTRRIASPAFVRKLEVRRIIKHHAFNVGAHLNNDIALIQLAENVEFNQYLRPVCLPPASLKLGPESSKDCVVVGFGKSRFSQDANYLHAAHFAKVPIISKQQCALWYAEQDVKLAEGMMCAGYSEGKRDACQGDSGSGLFCRHSDTNQFFVAGVVSFGIKCATPKLPGVYTSVPHYVDWINRITGNNGHLIE